MEVNGGVISKINAALICVLCDSPAIRKLLGFFCIVRLKAAIFLLKTFPTNACGDKTDFSGFDREEWPLIDSYTAGVEQRHAKTAKARNTMHIVCIHCLLDYWPASAFCLFGFERMNRILGNVHTSICAVEIQLIRKFISKQQIHSMILSFLI